MNDIVAGLLIAFFAAFFAASATFVAWLVKQVVEHSKWMAVTAEQLTAVRDDVKRHEQILARRP